MPGLMSGKSDSSLGNAGHTENGPEPQCRDREPSTGWLGGLGGCCMVPLCQNRNQLQPKVLGRGNMWEDDIETLREKLRLTGSFLSGCRQVRSRFPVIWSHPPPPQPHTLWRPVRASPPPPNSIFKKTGLEISVFCSSWPLRGKSHHWLCVPGTDCFCPEPILLPPGCPPPQEDSAVLWGPNWLAPQPCWLAPSCCPAPVGPAAQRGWLCTQAHWCDPSFSTTVSQLSGSLAIGIDVQHHVAGVFTSSLKGRLNYSPPSTKRPYGKVKLLGISSQAGGFWGDGR